MTIDVDYTGARQGTCGFRLMPNDELAYAPSACVASTEASGHGWVIRYTWVHPDDGEQSGILLIGSRDDDGKINAAWLDSWHQKPAVALLTGSASGSDMSLTMEYDGWTWLIDVTVDVEDLRMRMHNVVPDSAVGGEGTEGMQAGPYLVMDARWG